jgi:hypothetical protein
METRLAAIEGDGLDLTARAGVIGAVVLSLTNVMTTRALEARRLVGSPDLAVAVAVVFFVAVAVVTFLRSGARREEWMVRGVWLVDGLLLAVMASQAAHLGH